METNPYADTSQVYTGPPIRSRPGGVTLVGVLAIVLGVLGILGTCAGGAGLLATPFMQNAFQPPPNAPPFARVQFDLNQEMMAINQKYLVPMAISMIGLLVIGIWLTVGGVQTLRMVPSGRKLLMFGFLATIVFEVLRSVLFLVMQLEYIPIYQEAFNRAKRDITDRAQSAQVETLLNMMYGGAIFGLVIGAAWLLIKVVIYGLCARYLSKPNVVAAFEQEKATSTGNSAGTFS